MRILILGLIYFLSLPAWGFLGGSDLMGMGQTLTIAATVQKAVENGNWVFVAVIVLMFGVQVLKIVCGSKSSHVKRNAAQYSAIGGMGIGAVGAAVTGGDPVSGGFGGLVVGNAASGLYSSIAKPLVKKLSGGK